MRLAIMANDTKTKSKSAVASFIIAAIAFIAAFFSQYRHLLQDYQTPSLLATGQGTEFLSQILSATQISKLAAIVFSVLAILLGIVALFKIKKNNLQGKGWAIAGIVIGVIALVLALTNVLAFADTSYSIRKSS